jgi:hypothetical protein
MVIAIFLGIASDGFDVEYGCRKNKGVYSVCIDFKGKCFE